MKKVPAAIVAVLTEENTNPTSEAQKRLSKGSRKTSHEVAGARESGFPRFRGIISSWVRLKRLPIEFRQCGDWPLGSNGTENRCKLPGTALGCPFDACFYRLQSVVSVTV